MSEALARHGPASIWNPAPQAPVTSITNASASFWPHSPVHPIAGSPRSLSVTRAPQPSPLSSSSGSSMQQPDPAPAESTSRGRSRSTSTSVVYDLLVKTTTGQRGSMRTASQPPHQAGLNTSVPSSSKPPPTGRPRMASMQSEDSLYGSSPSRLADLHDPPLSASMPHAGSPISQPGMWNDLSRSPLLGRQLNLLQQQQAPQVGSPTGTNGLGRAGSSLPNNDWNAPRGRPPNMASPPTLARGRELSPISVGGGGIGYSNMSPFTRDGGRALAYGTSPGGSSYSHRPREHSVSIIGRGRGEMSGSVGPLWNGAVEEDDETEEHPPTRSGATSRRHSLAVLPPRSAQVSHGFSIPPGSAPIARAEPYSAGAAGFGGHRSLGFTDDELSADLNSLQLSLEAQAPSQPSPYATSPQQRTNLSGYGTSPGFNAAATARAYFTNDSQPTTPFSPFSNQQLQQQQQSVAPARSMPPYASSASYTPQQALDLIGPPVYFGAQAHPQPELVDLGRGLPMHLIPAGSLLYFVEFKAGRTDLFYVADPAHSFKKGDLVIVEADRGKDLGRVVHDGIVREEVLAFQKHQAEMAIGQMTGKATAELDPPLPLHAQTLARMVKEIHPKQMYGLASPGDVALLSTKQSDEAKALMIVRARVESRQLPMALTDAEWQIDRRKLTIFYVASRRIDFRELVRELFKVFKTRIWFSPVERQVEGPTPPGVF